MELSTGDVTALLIKVDAATACVGTALIDKKSKVESEDQTSIKLFFSSSTF